MVIIKIHDEVIEWKHFPRYWPFVRGIHQSPVNSPHKGQWRGTLMLFLICAWINGWVNNREAGDLRHHHAHHDVIVMHIQFVLLDWLPMSWATRYIPYSGVNFLIKVFKCTLVSNEVWWPSRMISCYISTVTWSSTRPQWVTQNIWTPYQTSFLWQKLTKKNAKQQRANPCDFISDISSVRTIELSEYMAQNARQNKHRNVWKLWKIPHMHTYICTICDLFVFNANQSRHWVVFIEFQFM